MSYHKELPLHDGNKIPQIGLGTWLSEPGKVEGAIEAAARAGYRHFDLAKIYLNQAAIGKAFKNVFASGIKREDCFIVSKLWNNAHKPHLVEKALDETLAELGLDYLDLYLIHWPVAFDAGLDEVLPVQEGTVKLDLETSLCDTWKAVVELKKTGKVKSIGVSNFSPAHIDAITAATGVKPVVNQIEAHPLLHQDNMVEYHKKNDIVIMAYSPLGNNLRGEPKLFEYPEIKEIAKKYNAEPAQVLIAWGVHRGYSVIPKSVDEAHIKTNFEQIMLSQEDYEKVCELGYKSHVRYNVGFTYQPKWDIDVFGEDFEKDATHQIKVQ